MAKKPGFTREQHGDIAMALSGMVSTTEIVSDAIAASYPASSPQARSVATLAAAIERVRKDLEIAAHAERVPNSMILYGLEVPEVPPVAADVAASEAAQ